jgi:tripartite-type tricarboxylate transporter receptor subunit TctC
MYAARRNLCALAIALAAATAARSPAAQAQTADYPTKSIHLIVPFPPGGGVDLLARLVGQSLNASWGQPVVIENRPGVAGTLAGEYVAQQPADGYTVLITVPTHMVVRELFSKPKYDPVRDFTPVTLLISSPFVWLVAPGQPFHTLKDLVDYAKSNPLSYGTSGVGSPQHVHIEVFNLKYGTQFQHVAYRGVAPAMNDVAGGHIPSAIGEFGSSKQLIETGKVGALAIMAPKRNAALPDLPTFAEAGYPGFDQGTWFGAFVRAGTPKAIVDKLAAELTRLIRSPEMGARLKEYGWEAGGGTPEEFAAYADEAAERDAQAIRQRNIRIE